MSTPRASEPPGWRGSATRNQHVADGINVYAADSERNAIYVVKDALGTPKKKKLAEAKGVQAIAVDGDKLYFATDAYEDNKPAGIIGVIKLPQ